MKLQDLLDLVKPPLGGSSGKPKREAMELDDNDKEQEKDMSGRQHSSGESNLDLG